jgi:hypothetical protein
VTAGHKVSVTAGAIIVSCNDVSRSTPSLRVPLKFLKILCLRSCVRGH